MRSIKSNQTVIKPLTSVGEELHILQKGDIFLISFLVVRCRSELSRLMEMNTGADPLARSTHVLARECTADSPFPLLLLLCHLSISPMVSSNGLLLHRNRFHLPIKPRGRARWGTKDSESMSRKKESRRIFFFPAQTHLLPLLPSSLVRTNPNAAESLFSFCPMYYNLA